MNILSDASMRAPSAESRLSFVLLTAAALASNSFASAVQESTYALLVLVLAPIAWADARYGVIPDLFLSVGLLAAVSLKLSVFSGPLDFPKMLSTGGAMLIPAIVTAVVIYLIRALGYFWRGRPGMGMGDVKLAFVMGSIVGYHALGLLYAAVCIAGMYGAVGMLRGRIKRDDSLRFAPFVLVTSVAYPVMILTLERWLL